VINIIINEKQFSYLSVQYQLHSSITRYSNVILNNEVLLPHFTMGFAWTLFSFWRWRQRILMIAGEFLNVSVCIGKCNLPSFSW